MSTIDDGGPAYPSEQGHTPDGTWNQTYCAGMSLRDWFAGQIAAAFMSRPDVIGTAKDRSAILAAAAQLGFEGADAMIAARSKGGEA